MDLDRNSRSGKALCKVSLTLTIIIPGCERPVRLRDVEFLIVEERMSESILGRPFLKSIGFDFDKHLREVRNDIHGKSTYELKNGKLASSAYQGIKYRDCNNDPVDPPSCLKHNFGTDSKESIHVAFENIIKEASKNGMSETGTETLSRMLDELPDRFRINLGPDTQAKIRPLKIELKPGSQPSKCAQRRYAPAQMAFIKSTIRNLEKVGAVVKNPSAKWASPALAVPKPGTATLRFTVDLRGINAKTIPIQATIPHAESMVQDCKESKVYENIEFCHGSVSYTHLTLPTIPLV